MAIAGSKHLALVDVAVLGPVAFGHDDIDVLVRDSPFQHDPADGGPRNFRTKWYFVENFLEIFHIIFSPSLSFK